MNNLIVNFPVAPPMVMPEPLQTVFLWISGIGALLVLLYSIKMSRSYGSAVPLLMVIAAGAAIPLESLVGLLGHVVHPVSGSIKMYEAYTRVIPWHMFFAYVAGFGVMYLVLYPKMVKGNATPRFVWATCGVSVVLYILIEIYPVSAGLWVYYDDQPLWLWKGMAPLTWCFMNTACEITGAALMCLMLPYLKGWKQLLIIPLGPMGALMGHLGSGWPMYTVINSDAHSTNLAVQSSGLVTVGLAIFIMWICVVIIARPPVQHKIHP